MFQIKASVKDQFLISLMKMKRFQLRGMSYVLIVDAFPLT